MTGDRWDTGFTGDRRDAGFTGVVSYIVCGLPLCINTYIPGTGYAYKLSAGIFGWRLPGTIFRVPEDGKKKITSTDCQCVLIKLKSRSIYFQFYRGTTILISISSAAVQLYRTGTILLHGDNGYQLMYRTLSALLCIMGSRSYPIRVSEYVKLKGLRSEGRSSAGKYQKYQGMAYHPV